MLLDEKEKRAYLFVSNILQKTQDSMGSSVASHVSIETEINLNLKSLTNYQLKLQLKAEEAISDLATSTNQILQSTEQLVASNSETGQNPIEFSEKVEQICKGLD